MKKYLIPTLILLALALAACGQSAEGLNNAGNEAFESQDYEGALVAYHQAEEESPELAEPHYNAANAHYRLADYASTQGEIEQALVNEETHEHLDQNGFYNLGNTFFQTEQYEMAIEAYKEALRLNPSDPEAKQNLELALRQLQQQQQEQEQQQEQQQENQDQQDDQQQNDQQQDGQQDDQQQNDQQQDGQQDEQQQDDQQQDGQQDDQQQNDQQQDGQQDEQQQDDQQQDGQQDQQRQDEQQQNGQPDDQQPEGQAGNQPRQMYGLSAEQARQLFEAAAQGTASLEEFLQQILVFPGAPPAENW